MGIVLVVTSGGRVAVLLQLLAHVRRANCVQGFFSFTGNSGKPLGGTFEFSKIL